MLNNEIIISSVLKNYDIHPVGIEPLGSAGRRTVYKLLTKDQVYVLRMSSGEASYEKQKKDSEILKYLAEKEYPSPKLIPTKNGDSVFKIEDTSAFITTYIDGIIPDADKKTLFEMGILMGKLHNLPIKDYPHVSGWTIQSEAERLKQVLKETDFSEIESKEIIPQVLDAIERQPDLNYLPKSLIHTDIHPKNMIKDVEGKNYLIDWDDAGIGVSIIDFGYVLSQVCMGNQEIFLDIPLMKSFIEGYSSIRTLTEIEKDNMIYAMQQCSLIYIIQHWIPRIDVQNWERYKLAEKEAVNIRKLL